MSVIDKKLVAIENELRARGFRLYTQEFPDGTQFIFRKEDVFAAFKRSCLDEMPVNYIISIVESNYAKLKAPGPHNENACNALKEYDRGADRTPSPLRYMEYIASKYETTTEEMRKHWKCIPYDERERKNVEK